MAVDPSDEACAALLDLAWHRADWIARRVTRLTFVDEYIVEKATTCEIDLSHADSNRVINRGGRLLLPIADFVRRRARNIELFDVGGAPLPLLTRVDERLITARGLAFLSERIYGRLPLSAHGTTRDDHAMHILYEIGT